MPFGCCRAARGDGCHAEARSGADGTHYVGNAALNYGPDLHLEPVHLEIAVDLLDATFSTKRAKMTITHTIKCNNVNFRSLTLNGIGFEDLSVKDLSGLTLQYRYDGELITIIWDQPFAALGETRQVQISYYIDEPVSGFYFSTGAEPDVASYVVTDNETERARYWVATVDAPSVRPTLKYSVKVYDTRQTVLANGKFVSETINGEEKVVVYSLEHGCPSYLLSLAVGRFVQFDDKSVNGCPISYFGPVGIATAEQLERSFGGVTPKTMEWMQSHLGPFPFRKWKYFQVVTPKFVSAMENITLTTWNTIYLLDENWALEYRHWVDMINCHEMAHSYFGDSVVIKHFDSAWLKESWADYMESCWLAEFKGQDEHLYNLHLCSELYFEECNSYMRPIATRRYNSSWQLYDNHLYPGGARRLHMLRKKLGETVFWTAVRDYLKTYSWEHAQTNPASLPSSLVETDLFRYILEKHSGFNLAPFFDQWIYGRGYPKLAGAMKHDPITQCVTITLTQTQEIDSAQNKQLFEMDVPVEVTDSKGKLFRGMCSFKNAITTGMPEPIIRSATLSFSGFDGVPTKVIVDPEYSLLFALEFNPGEDILVNVLEGKDTLIPHKIWAIKELVRMGTKSAYRAIKKNVCTSQAWYGLQIEAARAAKAAKSFYYVNILCDLLDTAENAMALAGITNQCIGVRDGRMREALLKFLARPAPLPYRSHARALEALGGQVIRADLQVMLDHANAAAGGWNSLVRCGAIRGLSQLCTQEGYDWILALVDDPKEPERSRAEAVRCLGTAAYWLAQSSKSYAQTKLLQLLQDPSSEVRKAAVGSLVTIKAGTTVVDAVKAIAPTLSNQDQPWLVQKIESLNKMSISGDSGTVESLKTELAALRDRVAKLEAASSNPSM